MIKKYLDVEQPSKHPFLWVVNTTTKIILVISSLNLREYNIGT